MKNYRNRIVLDNGSSFEVINHNFNKLSEDFSLEEIEIILMVLKEKIEGGQLKCLAE